LLHALTREGKAPARVLSPRRFERRHGVRVERYTAAVTRLRRTVIEPRLSLKKFIAAFPIFESRTIEFIGPHSTQLDQGEVFWAPIGYTLLRDLSFVAE